MMMIMRWISVISPPVPTPLWDLGPLVAILAAKLLVGTLVVADLLGDVEIFAGISEFVVVYEL
jgi:hypothetical protein